MKQTGVATILAVFLANWGWGVRFAPVADILT